MTSALTERLSCMYPKLTETIFSDKSDKEKIEEVKQNFTKETAIPIDRWLDSGRSLFAISGETRYKVAYNPYSLEVIQANIKAYNFLVKNNSEWQSLIISKRENNITCPLDANSVFLPMNNFGEDLQKILEGGEPATQTIASLALMNYLDIESGKKYFLDELVKQGRDITKIKLPENTIRNLTDVADATTEHEIINALGFLLDKSYAILTSLDKNYSFPLMNKKCYVVDLVKDCAELIGEQKKLPDKFKEGKLKYVRTNIDFITTNILVDIDSKNVLEDIVNVDLKIIDYPRIINTKEGEALLRIPPQFCVGYFEAAAELLATDMGNEKLLSKDTNLYNTTDFMKEHLIKGDAWEAISKADFEKKHESEIEAKLIDAKSTDKKVLVKQYREVVVEEEYEKVRVSNILSRIGRLYYLAYHAQNKSLSENAREGKK